jgi:uncharacterized Zn-binding protein involved in type VI secretion
MAGKPIQRVGDFNSGGGIIASGGQPNILVNGRPAAKQFDLVTPHWGCSPKAPQHCVCFTSAMPGSKTVRANGQPLILAGDKDTCMTHTRVMGSTNVLAQ